MGHGLYPMPRLQIFGPVPLLVARVVGLFLCHARTRQTSFSQCLVSFLSAELSSETPMRSLLMSALDEPMEFVGTITFFSDFELKRVNVASIPPTI